MIKTKRHESILKLIYNELSFVYIFSKYIYHISCVRLCIVNSFLNIVGLLTIITIIQIHIYYHNKTPLNHLFRMSCVYCIAPIHWCCSSYEGLNSELLFITFGIFRHFLCLFSFSINIYNYTFKTTIIQTVIF